MAVHLGVEEDFRPARKAHPALVVRDLPALEASCVPPAWRCDRIRTLPPGAGAYVDDPFGNRIELIAERLSRRTGRWRRRQGRRRTVPTGDTGGGRDSAAEGVLPPSSVHLRLAGGQIGAS